MEDLPRANLLCFIAKSCSFFELLIGIFIEFASLHICDANGVC